MSGNLEYLIAEELGRYIGDDANTHHDEANHMARMIRQALAAERAPVGWDAIEQGSIEQAEAENWERIGAQIDAAVEGRTVRAKVVSRGQLEPLVSADDVAGPVQVPEIPSGWVLRHVKQTDQPWRTPDQIRYIAVLDRGIFSTVSRIDSDPFKALADACRAAAEVGE